MILNKFSTLQILFIGILIFILSACEESTQTPTQRPSNDPETLYQRAQDYLTAGNDKNDIDKGIYLLEQLSEKGYVLAQNKLGYLYIQGEHVEKELAKAYHWYSLAAETGFTVSQFNLAEMQWFGMGTKQDRQSAIAWYQKAALQGYPSAMLRLAEAYATGSGTEQDLRRAYAWYQVAMSEGVNLPSTIPNEIAERMSEEQQKEAHQLITDLKWKLAVAE